MSCVPTSIDVKEAPIRYSVIREPSTSQLRQGTRLLTQKQCKACLVEGPQALLKLCFDILQPTL